MGKIDFNKQLEGRPKARSLVQTTDGKDRLITFSFRFFDQREFFGIAEQDSSWFASLFERLGDLNGKSSKIIGNYTEREKYRLHPIDWNSKNIPVTLDDLTNIPKMLRENAEPDFLWQFQLSTAKGRVIGFFNSEYDTFYIVLLDAKHNMQPSGNFNYSVNNTQIAPTPYEQIKMSLSEIEKNKMSCPHSNKCPLSQQIDEIYINDNSLYISIDSDLKDKYEEEIKSGTFRENFEEYLLSKL